MFLHKQGLIANVNHCRLSNDPVLGGCQGGDKLLNKVVRNLKSDKFPVGWARVMALRPSGLVIGIPYKLAPAALRSGQGVFNPLVGTGRVQNCVECVG